MNAVAWIKADDALSLMAVVMVVVVAAMQLETTVVARWIPAPVFALLAGFVLTNLGIVPDSGPLISAAFDIVVPIAIPLLLLKANLRVIAAGIGSMLGPFLLAYAATIVGTVLAFLIVPLGPQGPAFAATSAAGLLGGSVNFVTVAQSEGLSSAGFALASASFIALQVPFVALQQWMIVNRRWIGRFGRDASADPVSESLDTSVAREPTEIVPLRVLMSVAVAIMLAAVGHSLALAMGAAHLTLPLITGLALMMANLLPRQMEALQGDQTIGGVLLLVYLTLIAMTADVRALEDNAGAAVTFLVIVLCVHLAVLLGAGWLLRWPLPQLLLASNATVGGPATAASLAQAARRTDLLAPAVLAGTLGYATATFVSLVLAAILAGL
jgi:uncharacterized membrane protein